MQIFILFYILSEPKLIYSVSTSLEENSKAVKNIIPRDMTVHNEPGKNYLSNCKFTFQGILLLFAIVIVTWLFILLFIAGNIHPNPGPSFVSSVDSSQESLSSSSLSSALSSSTAWNLTYLSKHLSFVHYNVQSIAPKIDLIAAELFDFDILAFSETWLNASILTENLQIQSFCTPERKDRVGDSHGGVMLFVKDNIFYQRRADLEPRNIECIWIELILKQKHILFGLFYRPPNTDMVHYSAIEDSIHLAVDTGIKDIIITGDFNYNMLSQQSSRKINAFCEQFSLCQMINEPTHFTETSSSLIDLVLVNDKRHVLSCGVGEPFVQQDLRYHCPIFGVLNFSKPKRKSFTRRIWRYDQADYNLLRQRVLSEDWNTLQNSDINVYTKNLVQKMLNLAEMCIPNKVVTI
ncbi:MAG: endonuclease/exonuclease/phosphatase family protein [Candidatus Thiodiazotropha endolucinida]|nr:endonuclease/exonuclease/phosphatase family protein [Candidatus Thiodiazotropha taylori]MCW4261915.1 endonuclease/exonuclease/phosphatase family protein [Candidatus Thiodiazotropha endolucinida]